VTRSAPDRYGAGMTQWQAWSAGLTVALITVGCGSSSSNVGDEPSGGRAGSGGSGGNTAAGSGSAGKSAGGTTSTAGTTSQGGSAGTTSMGGSGTGGTGGGGGSVSQAGSGGGPSACKDPVPIGGGWELCSNDKLRRPTVGSCDYAPRARKLEATGGEDACLQDADCTAKPNGMCDLQLSPFGPSVNVCSYGCAQDSECGSSQVCVCASTSVFEFGHWTPKPAGACRATDGCKSDADCSGGSCSPYDGNPGCYSPIFGCETPEDECSTPEDCPDFPGDSCTFNGTHRACERASCVAG
jgi:hypothetical protein